VQSRRQRPRSDDRNLVCHSECPWAYGPPIEMKVNLSSPPRKRGSKSVQKELDSRFRGNDVTFDGASMGLWPTQRDKNRQGRHPRVSGGPSQSRRNWIPAFAGMTSKRPAAAAFTRRSRPGEGVHIADDFHPNGWAAGPWTLGMTPENAGCIRRGGKARRAFPRS
jgi:hypothetical protein